MKVSSINWTDGMMQHVSNENPSNVKLMTVSIHIFPYKYMQYYTNFIVKIKVSSINWADGTMQHVSNKNLSNVKLMTVSIYIFPLINICNIIKISSSK